MTEYIPPMPHKGSVRLESPDEIEAAIRSAEEIPEDLVQEFISLAREGYVTYWRQPDGTYWVRAEVDPLKWEMHG